MWIRQVAKKRPVEVAWKLFSLAVINHGKDYNAEGHAKGFRLERALLAARRAGGNDAFERLYIAFGEAQHGRRDDLDDPAVIRGCLKAAGLPDDLYDAALADASTEADLLAEHEQAVEQRGAFGVPTLVLQGSDIALYGPVVDPIPDGQESLELWDHTLWALRTPHLWELKRERKFKLQPQHVID